MLNVYLRNTQTDERAWLNFPASYQTVQHLFSVLGDAPLEIAAAETSVDDLHVHLKGKFFDTEKSRYELDFLNRRIEGLTNQEKDIFTAALNIEKPLSIMEIVFGGFAPNSESAEILSKALGNRTVLSGSISRGKNDPSQSLQMMSRPLMSPDELKTLPKGHFILAKTGNCPMQTRLPLFLKWGIQFGDAYEVPEQAARSVKYADRFELEQEIVRRRDAEDDEWEEPPMSDAGETRKGGQQQSQAQTAKEHSSIPRRPPLRTD